MKLRPAATVDVVPDRLVAGGGWYPIKGSVTNVSAKDVPDVRVDAYAWNQVEFPEYNLHDYVKAQVKAENGSWRDLGGDPADAGRIALLKAGQTKDFEMRVQALAKLPDDLTYAEFAFSGSFADVYRFPDTGKEVDCRGYAHANDDFRLTRPSPTPTPTPTKTPKPTATPTPTPTATRTAAPVPAPEPAGVGDELADTGSSGTTTTLAAIGGSVVALGAAAVLVGRRRKG